jgi:mono/diheme cytochrome c family protein
MRLKRLAGLTVLVLGLLLVVGITATIGWRPFIGPRARALTERRIESTPARLERGKYLVHHVSGCIFCHSELNTAERGLPIKDGMAMAGRNWAGEGIPWLTAPNLTPDQETGAGDWTDDMIARAVREGIGHDGRTLFPIMPYGNLKRLSDEDLASVVSYIRSLPAVRRELPKTQVPFPVSRFINDVPEPITGTVPAPDLSTPRARGEYLVTIASCADCHSPMDSRGQFIPGLDFSGGNTFPMEGRQEVASANLTPSPNGIPYYTDALFLETIRTGRVRDRELGDMMPWAHYRGMTDDDLNAIFAFLKTLKPIDHYVDNAMPPVPCARCRNTHGGGERNKKS